MGYAPYCKWFFEEILKKMRNSGKKNRGDDYNAAGPHPGQSIENWGLLVK